MYFMYIKNAFVLVSGDVPDIAIRLIAAVVILIVTAINVYGVKAATKIQVRVMLYKENSDVEFRNMK